MNQPTPFIITGLDPAPFKPLFGKGEAALKALGVYRYRADSRSGFPCRITLEDAPVGRSLLLVNHVSRTDDGPYRASHAIFVAEDAVEAARFENAVPPLMQGRVLSLRGFDREGMMAQAELCQPGEADAALRRLLTERTIVEVDIHTAVRGCFLARARRA